jgi:hypothetical protein
MEDRKAYAEVSEAKKTAYKGKILILSKSTNKKFINSQLLYELFSFDYFEK